VTANDAERGEKKKKRKIPLLFCGVHSGVFFSCSLAFPVYCSTMAGHDVQLIRDVQISNFYTTTPLNGSGKIIVALFSI
jgi:hypothetical protein